MAQGSLDGFDRWHVGSGRALDHDHLDAKGACRLDLGIGCVPAAVFRDDDVDPVLAQQVQLVLEQERAFVVNVNDVGDGQRRNDGVDAADEIVMGRGSTRVMGLLPSNRQEDATGLGAQRVDCLGDTADGAPAIIGDGSPGRPSERECRYAGRSRSLDGIGRYAGGVGMRRIDKQFDCFFLQMAFEALGSAKSTCAHRNRLRRRIGGSTGQRQVDDQVGAWRQGRRQLTRLRRTAQNQDTGLAHG